MAIPESQLETWSNQGATVISQRTHTSIRGALNADGSPFKDKVASGEIEVYLQGSYRNNTNIRGDSDVDLVVELTTTFASNLTDAERQAIGFTQASYLFSDLRRHLIEALQHYYGARLVDPTGNNSIKILPDSGRLGADVVPCIQYRSYSRFAQVGTGISFWNQGNGAQVINFPKVHYANGCNKNGASRTKGWYKPTVRMFKSARTYMIDQRLIEDGLVPSYFLECVLFNAADEDFGGTYTDIFVRGFNRLYNKPFGDFTCQHQQWPLFGASSVQWHSDAFTKFMAALKNMWDSW